MNHAVFAEGERDHDTCRPRFLGSSVQLRLLSGKLGDFLVKNDEVRKNDHPDDVWIVDQAQFEATYERVKP